MSCLFFCCLLLSATPAALSQVGDEAEYQVKLAYLYNFAQFIQWPPDAFRSATAPLSLCVAGQNPFQGPMEQSLRSRMAAGHPIEVKRLRPGDDPRASEKRWAERMLSALRGSSTLTVGESRGFAEQGGVINLTIEQDKVRFEINREVAVQNRLKISSKLLALAKIVSGGPEAENVQAK